MPLGPTCQFAGSVSLVLVTGDLNHAVRHRRAWPRAPVPCRIGDEPESRDDREEDQLAPREAVLLPSLLFLVSKKGKGLLNRS